MHLPGGPLDFKSGKAPTPLTPDEEAALAFTACGLTGYALAEHSFQAGGQSQDGGGSIMTHFLGRTIASGDVMHFVQLSLETAGILAALGLASQSDC